MAEPYVPSEAECDALEQVEKDTLAWLLSPEGSAAINAATCTLWDQVHAPAAGLAAQVQADPAAPLTITFEQMKDIWASLLAAVTVGAMLLVNPPPLIPPTVLISVMKAVKCYNAVQQAIEGGMDEEAAIKLFSPQRGGPVPTASPVGFDPHRMVELLRRLDTTQKES